MFAILYVLTGARRHGRLPPPASPTAASRPAPRSAATLAVARLGGDRGPGHLLGRRPPQAPRLLRPARATRTARTSTTAAAGAARCAASLHAHVGWLFIHTQRGRHDALRARPDRRPGRRASSTAPSCSGRSAGLVAAVRRSAGDRRHAARTALTGLLWGGAVRMLVLHHVTYSINSLCHFFGRRALRHRRRVAQPRLAGAALVRRGVAQQPPRVPDLGRARPAPLARSTSRRCVIRALEKTRARLGRRADRRPERQAPKPTGARRRRVARAPRPRCASALATRAPRAAVRDRALGRHRAAVDQRRGGPTFARALAAGARPRAARARPARARPRLRRGRRSRSTTSTPCSSCSTAGSRRRSTRAAQARLAAGGRCARRRLTPPPARARGRAAPARPPPQPRARRARGPPPLRRLQRVLRALPRRVDDLLVRDLLARRDDARGGAGARSSSSSAPSSALQPGRARARRRLRLGQLRAARGGASTASHVTGITLSEPQAELARERAADARASADRVDIRVADYRDLARRAASTRSPRSGWSSTSARRQIDAYARAARGACSRPGGRLLNHGIARLRHADPEAGPFSERFVFPDAAPLHLSRVLARARARGLRADARRGLRATTTRETLRALGADASTSSLDEADARWPAPSACASGASTCAPRGAASSRGFTSVYQVLAQR